MAKKNTKTPPSSSKVKNKGKEEPPAANDKKNGKKNSKTSNDDLNQSQQKAKNGRATVAQTNSWTGKLPGALLHEHCQKQKWNKVEYDMKKLPEGFIAIPKLSWVNPKTKENIQIKYHPPKEIVKPQETPLEARHYAATYALHRIAFNKSLHMVLPPNHKHLWSDLETERKTAVKENPKKADLEYSNDPFAALLEKRKTDELKKKEREAKQSSLEKVKKATITIGLTSSEKEKKISQGDKPYNGKSKDTTVLRKSVTNSYNKVTFPNKVWDNSILFDLDSELRILIEDTIRNHIEWSNDDASAYEVIKNDKSYSLLLEKLGFRKIHVDESLKYTYTFNDSLEWLIFHLPEDDLPGCFSKDSSDSTVKLRIAKDLTKERLVSKLISGGYSRTDAISALHHNGNDLVDAAVYLTNQLFVDKPQIERTYNGDNSLDEWLEEKNSLKVIYESKILEENPPKDDIYEINLHPEGLESGLLSLKVYRSKLYPYDLCGMFLVVKNPSYSLPNYIKISIVVHLVEYLYEMDVFGMSYIYTCVDWLEHNIMEIIKNPGPLYIPPDELQKVTHKPLISEGKARNTNAHAGKKLDIAKIESNYNKRSNSPKFKESLSKRAKLPAWKKRNDLINIINNNQFCLVTGETGSGKSTQIVQFILDDLNSRNDYNTTIICTQPRRISAIGLADRVSEERIDKCGAETGYIIRGKNDTNDETRISFVTTGVMLRMVQSVFGKEKKSQDSFFRNLGYIFIDEVHERSIDSDFLLIILKKMIKNFPDLKIILMSATIDKNIFDGYFNESKIAHVHIEGRTYPIDDFYLDDVIEMTNFKIPSLKNNSNYFYDDDAEMEMIKPSLDSKFFQQGNINYKLIRELVTEIDNTLNQKNDTGSILVFLPGVMEIKKFLKEIDDDVFWKLPLHSALSTQEQRRIFQNPPYGKRKIIASTNIAETSITIPDAVAVVDSGRVKSVQYDARSNKTKLVEIWASQAETKQRRGRAGRIRNGLCYKLFTKDTEKKMILQPIPEIKRTKLESIYLVVKSIGIKDVYEFLQNGLDPPQKENVENARRILKDIGALFHNTDLLTSLGKYLSMLPTDLRSGKMLIFGCIFGCLESSLILAAIGVTGSPFTSNQENRDKMKEVQQEFGKRNGDMISILNAFKAYSALNTMKERSRFCSENFVSMLRMNDIESTRSQYLSNLKEIGFIPFNYDPKKNSGDTGFIKLNRNNNNFNIIKGIITASVYPQVAMVDLPDVKYAQVNGGAIALDPEFKKIKYWTRNEQFKKILEKGEIDVNHQDNNNRIYPSTRIFMHPSSSLFINEEKSTTNPSFIVYNDSQETSKLYVHGITPTSTVSVLLFGGDISYDLTYGNKSKGIVLDDWLPIRTWCKNAVLMGKLRLLLDKTIQARLDDPLSNAGEDVLQIIEKLIRVNM